MKYKQGDIVEVPFPFSDDLTEFKHRPCVIISNDNMKDEVIVLKVSGVIKGKPNEFLLTDQHLTSSLPKQSVVITDGVLKIHKDYIYRKYSTVNETALKQIIFNHVLNFEIK